MKPEDITGHLVLLMAPSGSGKGKLVESLQDLKEELHFLKTYTSRPRREGTTENPRYEFVTREAFQKLIDTDALVEWAEFSGNFYGTPKSEVIDALSAGKVAFKEMELQGVEQMRALVPEEHITVIYVDAGGWDALKARIVSRAAMSDEHLELRRQRFEIESKAKEKADVVIQNHDGNLEPAQEHFRTVISELLSKTAT